MRQAQLGALATGVAEVDFEHGLQIGLIESFREAVAGEGAAADAQAILERLKDFTNAHFLAEQLLMRLHNYPGYEAHVQEHDRLVEALGTMQASLASGELKASADAAELLSEWFGTHVQTLDQAFAAFLKESRSSSGPTEPVAAGEPSEHPGVE
jgi:hemerythrin-like metal-binding protein